MASATIRVQFGTDDTGSSGHLSAEVDSRETGYNSGKTSFLPGDDVYVLVYKSDNVIISGVQASAGSISKVGSTQVSIEDEAFFEDSDSADLARPCDSIQSSTWLGRSLGSITLASDGQSVTSGAKGVAVAKIAYRTTADVYKLCAPTSLGGSTDFSVLVLFQGGLA